MDVTQALKDAENSLRDFIAMIMHKELGAGWEDKLGLDPTRVTQWRDRKQAELQRQRSGAVEERLLYYAQFYDLSTILEKNWPHFAPALGEWKTMKVWLSELNNLRDPDAHRRELLPHRQHLVLGISGEIRTRIVRFRSQLDTEESYFPRIERVRDSLGNSWLPDQQSIVVDTLRILRPGDKLDFVVTATDPLGGELEYRIQVSGVGLPSQKENSFSIEIQEKHIKKKAEVMITVSSLRNYHAMGEYDALVCFVYSILPLPRT